MSTRETAKHAPTNERPAAGRVEFMGCPFDAVGFDEAVDSVVEWCRGAQSPHTLLTINAALLVMMRDDPELAHACRAGDLIVADGMPVVWATRLLGMGLPERVAGVDLMLALLERGGRERLRVFYLGAKEEIVTTLVQKTTEMFPGLVIAGYRNGYFKEPEHAAIIEQIRSSKADMLFVGMPSPFKEVWCERHKHELGVPMIMGVGGSFDVISGFVRRAPAPMQRTGMEWAWRLMMEPRKMWKRYLVTNTLFLAHTAQAAIRHRLSGGTRTTP
jgi:N-acetylglucosaminyldiphosphoundecaprenol N-acetyl-beta-D-mannosaminyltransferase